MYSVLFPLAPGGKSRSLFERRDDAEGWIAYASRWCGPWELYEMEEGCAALIDRGDDQGPYAAAGWEGGS